MFGIRLLNRPVDYNTNSLVNVDVPAVLIICVYIFPFVQEAAAVQLHIRPFRGCHFSECLGCPRVRLLCFSLFCLFRLFSFLCLRFHFHIRVFFCFVCLRFLRNLFLVRLFSIRLFFRFVLGRFFLFCFRRSLFRMRQISRVDMLQEIIFRFIRSDHGAA